MSFLARYTVNWRQLAQWALMATTALGHSNLYFYNNDSAYGLVYITFWTKQRCCASRGQSMVQKWAAAQIEQSSGPSSRRYTCWMFLILHTEALQMSFNVFLLSHECVNALLRSLRSVHTCVPFWARTRVTSAAPASAVCDKDFLADNQWSVTECHTVPTGIRWCCMACRRFWRSCASLSLDTSIGILSELVLLLAIVCVNSECLDSKCVRFGHLWVPNMNIPIRILMRYIVPQVDVADTLDSLCIDDRTADSSSRMFQ